MRFFSALAISFILHIALGSTVLFFHKSEKLPKKEKIIPLRLEKFDVEKKSTLTTPPLKKNKTSKIKQPQKIEKPKVIKKKKIVKKRKKAPKKRVLKEQIQKKIVPQESDKKPMKTEVKNKVENKPSDSIIDMDKIAKTNTPQKTFSKNKETTDTLSKEEVQSYLSKIYSIIDRHKTYPSRAKKFGIQGEVIVQFTLYPTGKISDIKIIKSSGAKFLDVHTLNKVLEASKFFPKPPQEIEMRVPIRYFFQ
jgi:protein TonB